MLTKFQEFWQIFSNTSLTHYLTDIESICYFIFIIGFVLIAPVSGLFGPLWGFIVSVVVTVPVLLITLYGVSWGKSGYQFFDPGMLAVVGSCVIVFASNIYFGKVANWHFASKPIPFLYPTLIYAFLFFTIPIGIYLKKFYDDAIKATTLISMDFQVSSDFRLPIYVLDLTFTNTKSGYSIQYNHIKGFANSEKFIRHSDFAKMSLKDQFLRSQTYLHDGSISGLSRKSGDHKHQIPTETDQFSISWYSFLEDKYYSDDFLFPHDKMEYLTNYNISLYRYTKMTRLLTLQVFSGGRASLSQSSRSSYNHYPGRKGLANYIKIAEKEMDSARKEELYDQFLQRREFDGSPQELTHEIQNLKASKIERLIADQTTFYDWSVVVYKKGETSVESITPNIYFVDGQFDHLRTRINSNIRSSLPQVLSFRFDKKEYAIFLNMAELIRLVQNHIEPSSASLGSPIITFEIHLDTTNFKHTELKMILDKKYFSFTNFEIELEM